MSVNIMKIVHVVPFYYPVIGGVENVAQTIAEYMASKGNDVYVLTYNRLREGGANSLPRNEIIKNVHVIRLKANLAWSHGTYSSELSGVLERLNPDLVHVHVWRHPHVFQIAELKDKLGFKAILHSHAPFYKLSQLGPLIWFYHRSIDCAKSASLKKYDVIIALTPHEKNVFLEKFGVENKRIVVIPNGIQAIPYLSNSKGTETLTVLYVGRISREKNVLLLVKAMNYVQIKNAAVKLVVAGPDEGLVGGLKQYSAKNNINFNYLGSVSEEAKYSLYDNCTIFVNPSLYEGFGISLMEAQAFGKPCVITGNGGQLWSAPPGQTSLHVKPDPVAMGRTISLLLSDKLLYKMLSDNAYTWACQHVWSKILPQYDSVYELT